VILLRKKGPHGVVVHGKYQSNILLPECVESDIQNSCAIHLQQLQPRGHGATTVCAHPTSPGNMLALSKTASNVRLATDENQV